MSEQKYTDRTSGRLEIAEEKINELQGLRLETIQNEKERRIHTCARMHMRTHTRKSRHQ